MFLFSTKPPADAIGYAKGPTAFGMDRAQLQQVAELRLADADALIEAHRWEAAYYLLGYCIECALKACAAKQLRLHEVPDRKFVESFYTFLTACYRRQVGA